jgi:purine-nucleoside/S-methyl-5'-thioadenosine phosphorylase / adenosine deaminase
MNVVGQSEIAPGFADFGVLAFTTTRAVGSFGMASEEPAKVITERWAALRQELRRAGPRLATASQVHGATILAHATCWEGWLRADDADGHVATDRGTALAVTVADCVPVFMAHPSGATGLLHSGWRGTAARIVERGVDSLVKRGIPAEELRVHLGPAICGECYEVSGDVYAALTGTNPGRPTPVDLRAIIADHARRAGVRDISISEWCTRHHNERFFSHRAGDAGRQLGVIVANSA